ncbi:phenylalanine--tRNA ligase, mitochondrial-like [Paramacrobiotus metropolitanus]|uniref:phenylalanine--tRNA ligase, mitochondrial-like n=1 Tax=Paramacrobiotus metropolitanus TaxID=2943436 RepID=UPI0024460416|nr:phenylalanine--tRNA ligase, mitochondrial-like [Paramacrobiotus metropolitanus]
MHFFRTVWLLRCCQRRVFVQSFSSSAAASEQPSPKTSEKSESGPIQIGSRIFPRDEWTNITPRIMAYIGKNIYQQKNHPLWLIKERLVSYFHWKYQTPNRRSPAFAVVDNVEPVVTTEQNFDCLLVPQDHPSRRPSDSYYINKEHMLRAHTSAHQRDLMRSGLREFLAVGDVYRRDEIDSTHFPVFHQMEGVRLRYAHELSPDPSFQIFETTPTKRNPDKQETHTQPAVDLMEKDLKDCLEGAVGSLFGPKLEMRWNSTYFPFTHPSWELEVKFKNQWLELLGCGIMEQKLLNSAGVADQIGWAFGVGLERLAMRLYEIPDIRLFWSTDSGFLSQFDVDNIRKIIKYKPISVFPQCINDIAFWIGDKFEKNDFYELVRNLGGELVEQVRLIDEFKHPKTGETSNCYRIIYRHMEKTLTKEEANVVHKAIEEAAVQKLGVKIR